MSVHYCVRVYPNGDAEYTVRDREGMESWLDHNRTFRPGNALFVDGRLPGAAKPGCDDRGNLDDAQVAFVSKALLEEMRSLGPLRPWRMAYDPWEKATIYPEKTHKPFKLPPKASPAVEPEAGEEPFSPAFRM